jgi:hypothetical protein
MSNPLRILRAFDRHLTCPADMTLFGRAALALGFPNAPAGFHNTRDVDAILSFEWLSSQDENMDFWLAQQSTNAELSKDGLYLTHLFRESEVIIQPDWAGQRVRLSLPLEKLSVFRPATVDLVLTKMAQGDEQDLEDIRFLLSQESLSRVNWKRLSLAPAYRTWPKYVTSSVPPSPKCSNWQAVTYNDQ